MFSWFKSRNPKDYTVDTPTWQSGPAGATGTQGTQGAAGANGLTQTEVLELMKRHMKPTAFKPVVK